MNDRQSNEAKSTAREEIVQEQETKKELFPIVGIGASAGGLAAFTELLRHLPTDTGMGFVLIQHLAPEHKSFLSEILARETQMPVIEVQDGMSVEPNHVYVIPPNTKMTITQGRLRLSPRRKTAGMYMPVDVFFHSSAVDRGSKAIAIVLSGMDGDGAQGLKAIKAAGGITFAQCEATAKFSSMPNTAAASGHVDFILPPGAIAEKLAHISRHAYVTQPTPVETADELSKGENALHNIFKLLQTATKIDFTHYKHTTLKRQILRRMVLYRLEKLEDYVTYLQNNSVEVEALFQDLLIHVTSFFQDSNAFQALKNQVFPRIMHNRAPEEPIRIWVPGCSTGEEVYSIAICLLEFFDQQLMSVPKISIFGTDISSFAIDKARSATYIPSLVEGISPERLRRFFYKVEGGYQVSKFVREMCVFAKQNLISDPPFSHLDLISCRNVLISLAPALEKKVIPLFHYSLKPTGFLLLGTSESIGKYSDLFALVDKKQKIYSRKLTPIRLNFDTNNGSPQLVKDQAKDSDALEGVDLQKEADRIVCNKYAPPGVIINSDLEILEFRGKTSPYLALAPGKPSFNLLKMAQASLRLELRAAFLQAKRFDVPVRKEGIEFTTQEQLRQVNFEVIPLRVPSSQERYFLVLFEEVQASALPALVDDDCRVKRRRGKQTTTEQEVIELKPELAATKQELGATKNYLQSIIQVQQVTNQELITANEEILSSNEELQSINEELETAKEEIQATNEELCTTNQELQSRIQELNKVNSDLRNLLSCVSIAIVILANDLTIRRFTPMAQKAFNLSPTDVGRPLNHIKPNINVPNLEQMILEVIDTLVIKQLEVQDTKGHWYDLRIRPYKTLENQIDGAVIVLVDIDALKRSTVHIEVLKRSTQELKESRDYAEAIVETIQQPLIVLDTNLTVVRANHCFYETFQVSRVETQHNSIFELANGQWNIPQLRSLLEELLPQNNQIDNFEVEHTFENIGRKTMLVNACKVLRANKNEMILLAISDITERKLFEEQRNQLLIHEQSARAAAEAANRSKDEFLSIVSHELRNPLSSILGWAGLLRKQSFDAQQTAHALESIEDSTKSLAKLVEDILDISRITTGKLQLNVSLILLVPVIEAAIHVARPLAEAKNIQIEFLLGSPDTHRVSGDPERLQQVLWNLLSNSIKFTPVGGRITVKLEHIGSFAQIQVIDTGEGISAEFLPHVFERFSQADSSTARAHGGLGLGLSIVSHLVELHSGTVQAESAGEGQGTTITVNFPLKYYHKKTSVSSDFAEKESTAGNLVFHTMPTLLGVRVLVVDDDAGLLELLKIILEEYAAQVTAVTSAKEAIATLRANPGKYDVLLSDLGMPDEDGYALIRQVRALDGELGGIPAIALSAYVREEEQRKSLVAGFQRHIAKPVQPDQLASMIAELAELN